MSRLLASAILIGFMIFTAAPSAQNAVSGDWDLVINSPQGSLNATATMKQDGDKVTGKLTSPQGEVEMEGTMKGTTLTMAFSVQSPNGPLDIKVNAEVTGADMKGVMDFGMGTAEFTGKKK
ncbi:MAG: hypothetical protein ABI665_27255 [Vicinamibacterales bacterium]